MSENSKTAANFSFPTLSVLGVVFIVLKLCHVIDWSWWLVLLPFYAGLGLLIIGVIAYLIIKLIVDMAVNKKSNSIFGV